MGKHRPPDPRPYRVPAGHPPRGDLACIENPPEWRSAPCRRRGCRAVSRNRRNDRGRRHGPDHHAEPQDAGLSAEENRSAREMRDPRNIAVIGVTGYTGFELATLLLRHPGIAKPTFYVRESNGANCLSDLFP